jgi:hypothetical protein
MPFNIKFGRAKIPVLSVVGALAIGTVFTQLMFQNISNSSWIYVVWLSLGVVAFVLYRRHRGDPLWEPLETPPPPDREVVRKYLPPPQSARVRIGRKSHRVEELVPAEAALDPEIAHEHHRTRFLGLQLMMQRHGRMRVSLGLALCVALSVLAVVADLSPYDPFGPSLGWSPGIIMVALVAGWMLLRSHEEN